MIICFFRKPAQLHYLLAVLLFLILFQSCTSKKAITSSIIISPSQISCRCAGSEKEADSCIMFQSKKTVSLCGDKSYTTAGTIFNHLFINGIDKHPFSVSGTNNHEYRPLLFRDTLYLEEMIRIPVGGNQVYQRTCVMQIKIWYKQDSLKLSKVRNPTFPTYTNNQILDIFEEYQKTEVEYNEKTLFLMDRLFVASMSGNVLATKTFKNFEAKYRNLSGVYKERYDELSKLLKAFLDVN